MFHVYWVVQGGEVGVGLHIRFGAYEQELHNGAMAKEPSGDTHDDSVVTKRALVHKGWKQHLILFHKRRDNSLLSLPIYWANLAASPIDAVLAKACGFVFMIVQPCVAFLICVPPGPLQCVWFSGPPSTCLPIAAFVCRTEGG